MSFKVTAKQMSPSLSKHIFQCYHSFLIFATMMILIKCKIIHERDGNLHDVIPAVSIATA